jgi:Ca-activated chloride channel homolog
VTIAKDVKIQVEFNPARVSAYRLIGYENRLLAREDFNDDTKDAGDIGAGHSVTALYELVRAGADSPAKGADPLRYHSMHPADGAAASPEMLFVKVRYKTPEGGTSRLLERPVTTSTRSPSPDFQFAAAVAEFGMLLRDSEHKGAATLQTVRELATRSGGLDDPSRAEFLEILGSFGKLRAVTEG